MSSIVGRIFGVDPGIDGGHSEGMSAKVFDKELYDFIGHLSTNLLRR
jgi:hypothetical protein